MSTLIRPALLQLLFFTLLTGTIYPAVVTGVSQVVFPSQANGSLVREHGQIVGSDLIGQAFDEPGYFWGRPSATAPYADNGGSSTGSNLGPLNPALVDAVKGRVAALRAADPSNEAPVPIDLVTTSGSGLDPHISPAAAVYQLGRVARARNLPEPRVRALVEEQIEGRTLGLLGEPRVNVLRLNLALDRLAPLPGNRGTSTTSGLTASTP